ncbi:uncharacterized protein KY384_008814 [Bacidia gigantensis]|uniref:uncharacterized protein n=1 Tax=Bacidia gigantensis TaxID=2732470 RepID=UPI001D042B51|nr:uncharacterized protein KY384_008814 [Bacidia gigantensis]KAG8526613.1 hypothetical protein KY384_008814 [Bacidia gigantensis]
MALANALTFLSFVIYLSYAAPPPSTPVNPAAPAASSYTYKLKCVQIPAEFDYVLWVLANLPDCQNAIATFAGFALDDYTAIKKGQPMTDSTIIAPTYFVIDECAFTFYLEGDNTSADFSKGTATQSAYGILQDCGFYGEIDITDQLKVQVMDAVQALSEASQNGNPVYPPQLDPRLLQFGGVAPPGYYGGATMPGFVPNISVTKPPANSTGTLRASYASPSYASARRRWA